MLIDCNKRHFKSRQCLSHGVNHNLAIKFIGDLFPNTMWANLRVLISALVWSKPSHIRAPVSWFLQTCSPRFPQMCHFVALHRTHVSIHVWIRVSSILNIEKFFLLHYALYKNLGLPIQSQSFQIVGTQSQVYLKRYIYASRYELDVEPAG